MYWDTFWSIFFTNSSGHPAHKLHMYPSALEVAAPTSDQTVTCAQHSGADTSKASYTCRFLI
jgi:hypothetical protein